MQLVQNRDQRCRWLAISAAAAVCLSLGVVDCVAALGAEAGPGRFLWEIGRRDKNNAEFAHAPGGYREYANDGFYVVGQSDSRQAWPYVHPGPVDGWARGGSHTFVILFGLKAKPAEGGCELQLDLLDTHSSNPPRLLVEINDQRFEQALPPGKSDDSVFGQPAKGKPHALTIKFPASALQRGDNQIRLTTLAGSWLMYDWIGLQAPAGLELAKTETRTLIDEIKPIRGLIVREGKSLQPILVRVRHFGDETEGIARLEGVAPVPLRLQRGTQTIEVLCPAPEEATSCTLTVEVAGKPVASRKVTLKPVRKMIVYILPHSHTDIGYTDIQTAIEEKQVNNLMQGMAAAQKTAAYPEGARFVWNVEVLWAADLYLRRLSEKQRAEFFEAVKNGQVAMDGMYLNMLTGLCRPEELIRVFRYGTQLAEKCGVTIDSAMISDVPGYTWGTVTAMSQAGIKYFSVAPNYFDRIGTILREWENKPFYWVGPDGKSKVLVWIPWRGYALSHIINKLSAPFVEDFMAALEQSGYPYDIAHVRWSGHGDNATPDPAICEFVKEWNAKYAWPKFIITSTSKAFRAFEERYGDKLPHVRGDWTPYWEDGAGSSALETAMNRASSDRLAQAETLFALLCPSAYPAQDFAEAWNSVLLYSEHTWGAWCSVSEPERKETKEQWEIKQQYALRAEQQSRELFAKALQSRAAGSDKPAATADEHAFDVFNTLSWARTDLVVLPRDQASGGDRIVDDQGRPVPSQRLTSGELAFVARDVPPFAARRYAASQGASQVDRPCQAQGAVLDNGLLRVRVDEKTGGIVELSVQGIEGNFADTSAGQAINDYLYLPGDNLADLKRNAPVTIRVGERGPLVASLIIESDAPGCNKLRREVRLTAGCDYVELINTVDKQRLAAKSYHAKEGKESVNFAFPFDVPGGQVRLEAPLAVFRPEVDQMPSACKNWLTVGSWADVSNDDRGVTWVTLDAPLVQVGGITATLLNSQTNPDVWRKSIEPTQSLYAWVMNNHWGTNYRAYQEGPVVFRFVLRPHGGSDLAAAARFSIGRSHPLVAAVASGPRPSESPLVRVEPTDVLVTGLKPSDDGRGWIVRLYGASGQAKKAQLSWTDPVPKHVSLSDTSEKPKAVVTGPVEVPGWGVVTLRVER